MAETFGCGLDLGTMFIVSARDAKDSKSIVYTDTRNCFRAIPYNEEFEDQLRLQGCQFLRDGEHLYVLGNQAYLQAGMSEIGNDLKGGMDALSRPMRDGLLNPDSPKLSMTILRELMKGCIERDVGPARNEEILYFSVPANPIDSSLTVTFHEKLAQRYLCQLGYDARPIGEGLACVYSEVPRMHSSEGDIPLSGFGISFGAGMVNFCLAERGVPIDEFSLTRSGDWLDTQVARMTGQTKTKVMRIKEKKLNFNNIDETCKEGDVLLAYDVYYDELIHYTFSQFAKRFKGNRGSLDAPLDVCLSGGTACPPGFDKKVKNVLSKMDFPFEIAEVRLAGGGEQKRMLQAVVRGCYARAKQAAKKISAGKDALNELGV